MLRRALTGLALAAWASCAPATTALAGGWAVTTFDEIPAQIHAGQTYRLGYTILQHGITPVQLDDSSLRISSVTTGERHTFAGRAQGPTGHHVVDVTFPAAGEWRWEVQPGPFPVQPLGSVRVLPPGEASRATPAPVTAAGPDTGPLAALRLMLPLATAAAFGWFTARLADARRRSRGPIPGAASTFDPAAVLARR